MFYGTAKRRRLSQHEASNDSALVAREGRLCARRPVAQTNDLIYYDKQGKPRPVISNLPT
jgi:hypothetical protein